MSLFLGAETGQYPPGTTPKELAGAVWDNYCEIARGGRSDICAGTTALHVAARHGHLPSTTTARDLIEAKEVDTGRSALHVAAWNGRLVKGTSLRDLLDCVDKNGESALTHLLPSVDSGQIRDLMANTKAESMAEIESLGSQITCWDKTIGAVWMGKEMKRVQMLKAEGK